MMRVCLVAVFAILLTAGSVFPAQAGDHPHTREGWVLGFSLGGGTAVFKVGDDETDRTGGGGGNLRIAYMVSESVSLGLEGAGWGRKEDLAGGGDATWSMGVSGLGVTLYPGSGGWALKGIVGVGNVNLEWDPPGAARFEATEGGFGVALGAGYEFRLTRRFALGPRVDAGFINIGELSDGTKVESNFVNVSLSFDWYL